MLEAEEHPFTEQELSKKRLDDVFALLMKRIKTPDREHIVAYLRDNTRLVLEDRRLKTIIDLPDGMHIDIVLGTIQVIDKGKPLCQIVLMEGRLVFLFDDGTSYSLLSVLLDESLLEILSEYVTPSAQ